MRLMCRETLLITALQVTLTLFSPLDAQEAGAGRPGRRTLLSRAEEVALARSGAPPSVSSGARVYVFSDSGYVVAEDGSTDVSCMVNRSWPTSLEPECYDAEAAATIMPMEMHRTLLAHQGKGQEQVSRVMADGLADGRFRLPSRMAVVYMMSSAQRLVSDDGSPAGAWKPHLMMYSPFLTNHMVGHHGAPGLTGGLVVDSGKPTANLLVVVPEFIHPAPPAPSPARP